ncbi:MAG: hypothetical protein ABIH72_00615 [archaeon]
MIDLYKLQEIAQLVEAMNEAVMKLEIAEKKQDFEKIKRGKDEIMNFKNNIDRILK